MRACVRAFTGLGSSGFHQNWDIIFADFGRRDNRTNTDKNRDNLEAEVIVSEALNKKKK